jgi:hypothetical protein
MTKTRAVIESSFDHVASQVMVSRWFDPSWMTLSDTLGYKATGVFGLKDSHLTPGFDAWGFYHDLAHALYAVQNNEPWRLAKDDFGLRYTSSVEVLGETYHEPQTTQALQMEAQVLAIQAWLMRLENPVQPFDLEAWVAPKVRLLRFMDDFLLLRINLTQEGKRTPTDEETFSWLAAQVTSAYSSLTPQAVDSLWKTTAVAADLK